MSLWEVQSLGFGAGRRRLSEVVELVSKPNRSVGTARNQPLGVPAWFQRRWSERLWRALWLTRWRGRPLLVRLNLLFSSLS